MFDFNKFAHRCRSSHWGFGLASALLLSAGSALAAGGGAGTGKKPGESNKDYDYYLTGSALNKTPTGSGKQVLVLMGGGEDVDEAFKDMFRHAGCDVAGTGGTPLDVVIIRTSGADGYNPYLNELGKRVDGSSCVDSVESLVIKTQAAANDVQNVVNRVSNADVLFIAGGDQSTYVKLWSGTALETAIKNLVGKKVPVGGTSAGLAVLGAVDYTGENGSITSAEAMANPYDPKLTLSTQFLSTLPYMAGTVTDPHLYERDRMGRLVTFMARMGKGGFGTDWSTARGIGVTEATALVVTDGIGQVRYKDVSVTNKKGVTTTTYSKQSVYFLNWTNTTDAGFTVAPNQPLNFNSGYLRVQKLTACQGCTFDMSSHWTGSGVSTGYPYVYQGSLMGWGY